MKPHNTMEMHTHANAERAAERDPVCGMNVQPEKAAGSAEFGGRTYYFCSPRCLEKFRAEPGRYVEAAPAPEQPAPAPTVSRRQLFGG